MAFVKTRRKYRLFALQTPQHSRTELIFSCRRLISCS
jgi:hypothetical protein